MAKKKERFNLAWCRSFISALVIYVLELMVFSIWLIFMPENIMSDYVAYMFMIILIIPALTICKVIHKVLK